MRRAIRISRTSLIRISWYGEPSGWAENPDNWIVLWKQATLAPWSGKIFLQTAVVRLNIYIQIKKLIHSSLNIFSNLGLGGGGGNFPQKNTQYNYSKKKNYRKGLADADDCNSAVVSFSGVYFSPYLIPPSVSWSHNVRFPNDLSNSISATSVRGTRRYSWLRHCSTIRKVAGSIPDGVIGFSHWHNPSDRTVALGLTQPLKDMSTRNISWWVKAAGA